MSAIPVPKSYSQILSAMLDSFLARFGINKIKPGSPILSILEAAAQSDLRASQDIFSYLNSINLDRANGDAVDKIGADEDLPRLGQTFGTGVVTISDTSFDKITTKLYVSAAAPAAGATTIYVADASLFPGGGGSLYLGRGTVNYEGPLVYTGTADLGSYWSITLNGANPTQKFHNLQEPVTLAQGGNRLVSAGTIVRTAQGNANEAVEFSTLYSVVVPDGEVETTGVDVVAKQPGRIGRISAGAIVEFSTPPFTGANATNPLPYTNGRGVENQTDYKERIRTARQTRAKGTPLAISSGVLGILAPDENKTVLSSSFIRRQGLPGTLYIDDGTGYEERSDGVSIESISESASGGEQYFEVEYRPVAKAFVESTISEPFTLVAGAQLAVRIGGVTYIHTFSADSFRNIAFATAYEVTSSINSNPAVPFNARLAGNGDRFAIVADSDTGENLEVVVPSDVDSIDANEWFNVSTGRVDTMLLYKNDRLLSKDGRIATLTSNPQSLWAGSLTSPATVELAVDNTPAVTYSFTSQDFIDAETGFVAMSSANPLDSWVTVFNARIPGVTAVRSDTSIVFTSNLGTNRRSRLTISGGTLVSDGVLLAGDSVGMGNDFTLDRNTGQLRLATVLSAGDTLSAGTVNTRAFIESTPIPSTTLVTDGESWWVADGEAEIVVASIAIGTTITLAAYIPSGATPWGDRVRMSGGTYFANVLEGDWVILNDSTFAAGNLGAFRVAYVDVGGTYVEFERPAAWASAETVILAEGGVTFVRTERPVQRVVVPLDAVSDYTAATFADSINSQLRGATAYVNRTTRLRVRTNTFGTGDIALVAQDTLAALMLMAPGDAVPSLSSHLGSVEAGSKETGTPEFANSSISTVASTTLFDRTALDPLATAGHQLVWGKAWPDVDNTTSLNYSGKTAGWTVAEVVTGVTSGASGTIGSVTGGGAGGVAGTIVLTGATGTFVDGEVLDGTVAGAAAALVDGTTPAARKNRWSGWNQHTPIYSLSGVTTTVRNALERVPASRFYAASPYAIGPYDDFSVLIDEDQQQQRYAMNMYRRIKPTTAVYGATNLYTDTDNSNASLAASFGLSYDWLDYAAWMKARIKAHAEAGDTNKTVLYRYYRFGPEGEQAYVRYVYPTAASSAIGVTTDNLAGGQTQVYISIPSGAARTGVTVRNSTRIGTITAAGPGTLKTITYILGFPISTANVTKRLKVKPASTSFFTIAEVVTGATSGATGTVSAVDYGSITTDRGYLSLSAGNGLAFIDGETVNGSVGGNGVVDGTQYGLVNATLDFTGNGATDHGFTSHVIAVVNGANFVVGDVVVGATSTAMAIVREKSGNNLTVSELSGTFTVGENLSGTTNGLALSTVVSVTAPTNVLYVESISGAFASGLKNIVGRATGADIQYIEGVINVVATPTIGTVSWDVGEATTAGSNVANGDLVNISTSASLPSTSGVTERTVRITTLDASLVAQYWKGPADGMTANNTITLWGTLNDATYLSFFPASTATAKASDYETAINAIATAPITAQAIGLAGDKTGTIVQASFDEFSATADKHYQLADGINWVQTQIDPVLVSDNYSFTFKNGVSADLAGATSGWATEEIRMVPTTTKNVVDWLNALAVSGLSSVAEAAASRDGNVPQIATDLSGRIGSVRVQGGTANSASASVEGSSVAVTVGAYSVTTIKTSDVTGFSGGQWVAAQNFASLPKQNFAYGTAVLSITAAGVVTLDAASTTNAWDYANEIAVTHVDGVEWIIEKQGDFVSYQQSNNSPIGDMDGVEEGDWVIISGTAINTINSLNQGQFRIVRVDSTEGVFWIENDLALEETALGNMHFLTYDSILPGDKLLINSTVLGADNRREWTVASIHPTNPKIFTLDVSDGIPTAFTGPLTLGTSAPSIQVVEGTPSRMIKKIRTISPNLDPSYTDIKFETSDGYRQISEAAGTVIQSLDKLEFPTSLVQGMDGYRHSTGLIREANKVAYGDPSDPSTYPGIVAAGAQVNIEGPLVKRVTCSLALRLKTGVGSKDVKIRVRSAVASVINGSDVGESISISSLITAAEGIPGVVAVTWLAPVYGPGRDLISVQPFEKPMVLDLEQDVSISLVSE